MLLVHIKLFNKLNNIVCVTEEYNWYFIYFYKKPLQQDVQILQKSLSGSESVLKLYNIKK
jgi:hypothetical protein